MKMIFVRSAMGRSAAASLKRRTDDVFSTSAPSPVRLDSSTIRSVHDSTRQSAGTLDTAQQGSGSDMGTAPETASVSMMGRTGGCEIV